MAKSKFSKDEKYEQFGLDGLDRSSGWKQYSTEVK